jgi:hypothetical protein
MAMALLIEVNDSYAVCGFVIIHSFIRSFVRVGNPSHGAREYKNAPLKESHMDTTMLLIIVIVVILLFGGGWYGRGRWY